MKEFDPNAPAFGDGSQPADGTYETPVGEGQQEISNEPVGEVANDYEEQSETQVPYSRFKKFHQRATEAEQEAAEWRARYEALTEQSYQPKSEPTMEVPEYWRELYGDSEASKYAWQIQARQNEELLDRARQEAIEAVQYAEQAEQEAISENMAYLDDQLDYLADELGRQLTDKETDAILDIVDKYTPKDENGNYLGSIISMDKAWEIYELKQAATRTPNRRARNEVAGITAATSSGSLDATQQQERDKNFNPLDWNAWKSRLN